MYPNLHDVAFVMSVVLGAKITIYSICTNESYRIFKNRERIAETAVRHIDMYEDYIRMRDDGEKMDYIICILEGKYKVSESTIRRVIRRFSKDVR